METLQALNKQYLFCLSEGNYADAFCYASRALKLMPGHPQILGDLAMCHMRLGNYKDALFHYEKAIKKSPNETNLFDGMTELFGILGQIEKTKEMGLKALTLKANLNKTNVIWQIPKGMPPRISEDKNRNVIAFSLYGENPRYCETAILNVEKAQSLFPDWTCRFYINNTVPTEVQVRLQKSGAQLISTDNSQWDGIHPLMWRFSVMDDPSVDRYLLRDADSILSNREQSAVYEWCKSEKWFHHMRDYYTHTELILAGMFGGSAGVFANLKSYMEKYSKSHQGEQRVVDQHFLRHYVWPTVCGEMLSHDSWFAFNNSVDFPKYASETELGEKFHVGCNYSTSSIGEDDLKFEWGIVEWELLNTEEQVICKYASKIVDGSWRASLPQIYIENIKASHWKIRKINLRSN